MTRVQRPHSICLAFILFFIFSSNAHAEPQSFGVFAGGGYLASPSLKGAVIALGVRYRPQKYVALTFDAGYGVIGRNPDVQDRWWLMPAVAAVVPFRKTQIDFGVGLGLGATSGYATWTGYVNAPFGPIWAFQMVPTLRGHIMATYEVSKKWDLFVRVDLASLLLGGNSIGSRVNDPNPNAVDTRWMNLLVGAHFRAF